MSAGWPTRVVHYLRQAPAVVRITVVRTQGSTPREVGAWMLVAQQGSEGTIGGGRLEWEATEEAKALLLEARSATRRLHRVLGPDLEQCCGGVVDLDLTCYTTADLAGLEQLDVTAGQEGLPVVWLFGAGHVGRQLARILVELPLRLTWIDPREQQFPAQFEGAQLMQVPQPQERVADAPDGAYFVIMTHSHPLDYELCRAILQRRRFAWVGLIGSASKAARFRSRLRRDGLGVDAIARLVCPIGVEGIDSKWPAAIAVAVAAQLLQQFSQHESHELQEFQDACGGNCERCGTDKRTKTTPMTTRMTT